MGVSDLLELLKVFGWPAVIALLLITGILVPRRPYVRALEEERDYWRGQAERTADTLQNTTAQLAMANQMVSELRALAYSQGARFNTPLPAEGRAYEQPRQEPPRLDPPSPAGSG